MPLSMEIHPSDTAVTLRFPTVRGKRYQVQRGEVVALSESQWITVQECGGPVVYKSKMVRTPIGAEIVGTGDEAVVTLAVTLVPGEPQYFSYTCLGDIFSDTDALSDWEESILGTSPSNPDTDGDGLLDDWEYVHTGKFGIWPSTISLRLARNQTANTSIHLSNDTTSPVNYSVTLADNFGLSYGFEDSLTGNVAYTWEEISTTGTKLETISNADDSSQIIDLAVFTFPFFGNSFGRIHVSSNGLLTFGTPNSSHSNTVLPSISAPPMLIAPFWDDLDTRTIGDIYYKQESNRLIIQYDNVGRYLGGTTSAYTFQVVLFADGRIQFRYKTMTGVLDSATVGIQNSVGTMGLQIAHNASYVASQMTVEINPQSAFLSVTPTSGTVPANTRLTLDALFRSLQLPFGTYTATITTSHDAPEVAGPHVTTATLEVFNAPATVALTAPAPGTEILQGNSITLTATATDPEGMQKVEFYNGPTKISEDNWPPYSWTWHNPPVGTHTLTARAIDIFGGSTTSSPMSIAVLADADRDSLPDGWEVENGLSDTDFSDALGDADADRIPNLWEYWHGTDPNNPLARAPTARVVASNGSGDHLTLQEAYDAASDDDIIEVREGIYEGISAWGSKRIVWLATPANPASNVEIAPTYPMWASVEAYSDSAFDGFAINGHGGIVAYTSQARVVFTNCRLSDGIGDYAPGAVEADYGSTVVLRHCTVINNRCKNYGYSWGANAVYVEWNSRLAVQNSILWNPNANGLPEVQSDGTVTVASSIIGGGQYGAVNQDPSLALGGWITAGSPGLDAGLALGSAHDAQGELRPAGAAPDLGWDEFRDVDSDGLPDWLEDLGATDPAADHDADGLTNIDEYQTHGTSVLSADSDGDSLSDGLEVLTHGTNPLAADSDSDGMPDGWETAHGLDPLGDDASADSDGDRLTNFWEYTWGFDPADPSDAYRDTDNDGLPDWWEITYYGHPSNATASADADSDGLTNLLEYQYATNPRKWDTDGDLLPDGWEVQYNLNPRSSSGIHGADSDHDGDGLSNFQEMIHGSNPGVADTDSDEANDGDEVNQGSNPNDPGDGGQPPPADELVDVPFSVGDPSGSHSERWRLNIQANGPDDTRQFGFVSPDFGEMGTQTFKLRKANSYTITISHVATNIQEGGPDYDWEAKVGGLPSGDGDQAINHYFVVGNAWVVDNRQGLLTTEKHGNDHNIAQGRQARLLPIEIGFEKVGENEPITDNKNPATGQWMPGKGKKIFPDWKTRNDNTARNRVYIKVKAGIPNIQVHLKSFDVDDPSDDTDIDPNDTPGLGSGQDNLEYDGITQQPKPPFFVSNGSESIVCTTDAEGIAKVNGSLPEMEVTMQPGDNYRVAVALMPEGAQELTKLQVMDNSASGYISGDSNQQPSGFNGVVSPMLTTWRKLHIEVDTMEKWQGDKPGPDRLMVTGVSWDKNNPNGSSVLTLSQNLPEGNNFYQGGFMASGNTKFDVTASTENTVKIFHGSAQPTEAQYNAFIGQFELRDDDDRAAGFDLIDLLPRSDAITETVKQAYAPAYIEIEAVPHSQDFNTRPTIPFEMNAGTLYNPFTSLDNSQDMGGADRNEYWYTLLVMAYQYRDANDNDPTPESLIRGLTISDSPIYPKISTVYVEAVRDWLAGNRNDADFLQRLQRDIDRVVAHELGHAPGNGNDSDHNEGGLMGAGADEDEFSPATIRRFRQTPKWQN